MDDVLTGDIHAAPIDHGGSRGLWAHLRPRVGGWRSGGSVYRYGDSDPRAVEVCKYQSRQDHPTPGGRPGKGGEEERWVKRAWEHFFRGTPLSFDPWPCVLAKIDEVKKAKSKDSEDDAA